MAHLILTVVRNAEPRTRGQVAMMDLATNQVTIVLDYTDTPVFESPNNPGLMVQEFYPFRPPWSGQFTHNNSNDIIIPNTLGNIYNLNDQFFYSRDGGFTWTYPPIEQQFPSPNPDAFPSTFRGNITFDPSGCQWLAPVNNFIRHPPNGGQFYTAIRSCAFGGPTYGWIDWEAPSDYVEDFSPSPFWIPMTGVYRVAQGKIWSTQRIQINSSPPESYATRLVRTDINNSVVGTTVTFLNIPVVRQPSPTGSSDFPIGWMFDPLGGKIILGATTTTGSQSTTDLNIIDVTDVDNPTSRLISITQLMSAVGLTVVTFTHVLDALPLSPTKWVLLIGRNNGSAFSTHVIVTNDAGQTWSLVHTVASIFPNGFYQSATDGCGKIWITAQYLLMYSSDYGATWTNTDMRPFISNLNPLSPPNPGRLQRPIYVGPRPCDQRAFMTLIGAN